MNIGREQNQMRQHLSFREHFTRGNARRTDAAAARDLTAGRVDIVVVYLALWNALPGVEKRRKVGDRGALIDQLW